jgi:hypothetical protein
MQPRTARKAASQPTSQTRRALHGANIYFMLTGCRSIQRPAQRLYLLLSNSNGMLSASARGSDPAGTWHTAAPGAQQQLPCFGCVDLSITDAKLG